LTGVKLCCPAPRSPTGPHLMKFAKFAFPLLGVGLLWLLLGQTDATSILAASSRVGLVGMLWVLALYAVNFATDVASWQLTFAGMDRGLAWTRRLYVIRMIGEAYNNITPMASMGGEPIKAWLLKHRYGVSYRDVGAALVLAKTTSMVGLVLFVAVGCVLMLLNPDLSRTHKGLAGIGLAMLTASIAVFFLMQHWKLSTFAATRLGRTSLGGRLARVLSALQDMDLMFARFYSEHRRPLCWSTAWAIANWLLGVVEIYLIFQLIGHPIGWADAWIIESMVQLVRTATFFIPAGLGSQEGALMLTCGALTGLPGLGLSVALVRRGRELVWIALSLGLGSVYSVSAATARVAAAERGG